MKGVTLSTIAAPGCFGVHIAGGDGLAVDLAQIAQLKARGDFRQHVLVDEFHAQYQWRLGVQIRRVVVGRHDRHHRDDGGAAQERLQADGAMQIGTLRRLGVGGDASAHQIDDRCHVRPDRVEPIRIDAAVGKERVDQLVGAVGHEHEVVVEIGLEPQADPALHPVGVVLGANSLDRSLRGGDALDLTQHALAMVGEGPREQLAFGVERHLVGALRGAEHRHHDADDGNGNDDADRHHDAQAHMVPTDGLSFFADARRRHSQISCPLRPFCAPEG